MQAVNGTKLLNIHFLLVLFTAAPAAAVFGTVIVSLTSMHASLQLHKSDQIVDDLNITLLLSYLFPFDS